MEGGRSKQCDLFVTHLSRRGARGSSVTCLSHVRTEAANHRASLCQSERSRNTEETGARRAKKEWPPMSGLQTRAWQQAAARKTGGC